MQKTTVEIDPKIDREFKEQPERWAVELTIECADGQKYRQSEEYAKGDPPNPMTWEESVGKFMSLAEPFYGQATAQNLCRLVENIEKEENIRTALAACFV
jgi:2-methylcitrate dehydratase PrpD